MDNAHHRNEAERAVSAALSPHIADQEGYSDWRRDDLIALALVHATLANAPVPVTVGRVEVQP